MSQESDRIKTLQDRLGGVILGKPEAIRFAVLALLGNGHLLIDDVPGTGKTLLARALAKSVRADFKRIQCTPDLLPSDITGISVFHPQTREFEFRPGPVFTNLLLCDEINRATPRTQAALLEAMEERHASADGVTRPLPEPFFVIATQNPVEFQGTYPLPEAQLDRFFISIRIGYPDQADEARVLASQVREAPIDRVEPVLDIDSVLALQAAARRVEVHETIQKYIVALCARTRELEQVLLGASTRAAVAVMRAAQAWSLMHDDAFVKPDAVKAVISAVLRHRLILHPRARVSGGTAEHVIEAALDSVEVPIR